MSVQAATKYIPKIYWPSTRDLAKREAEKADWLLQSHAIPLGRAAGNEAGEHEPTCVARRPRFFAFCTRLSRLRLDQPPAHAADLTIPDSCVNGVRDCAL